jgi:hypothetical protein
LEKRLPKKKNDESKTGEKIETRREGEGYV